MKSPDKKIIREFYERLGRRYWSNVSSFYGEGPITSLYDLREKDIVRRLVFVEPNSLILDLGSGPGRWILEYAGREAQVIGLDISKEMILSSKSKISNIRNIVQFVVGDAEHLPLINGIFDIVNCFDAFPHFPNPKQALMEMKRVIKLKGKIIVEPSNFLSPIGIGVSFIRVISKLILRILNPKLPIWVTSWNRYDNPWRSQKMIEEIGLHVIHMRGVEVIPPLSRVSKNIILKFEDRMEKSNWFNFLGSRNIFICSLNGTY